MIGELLQVRDGQLDLSMSQWEVPHYLNTVFDQISEHALISGHPLFS